jgi:Holliday junction resolvase RusA-like endonuclease
VTDSPPLFALFLPGKTPGKARPRVTSRGTYMPRAYRLWVKSAVSVVQSMRAASVHAVIDCAVTVHVVVVLPAPRNRPAKTSVTRRALWKPPGGEPFPWIGKPDADNAAGSVLDALVHGGALVDDTLVSRLHVSLHASHDPARVGAHVTISALEVTP